MTMPQGAAAARIRRDLHAAESAIDGAVIAAARLMQTMVGARQGGEFEVHSGQRELIRLAAVTSHLLSGSTDLFRVHDGLSDLARERGFGDESGLTRVSGLIEAGTMEIAA